MKKVVEVNFTKGYEITEEELYKLDDNRRSIQSLKIELLKKNQFEDDEVILELKYIERYIEELIFKIKETTREKEFLKGIESFFENVEDKYE